MSSNRVLSAVAGWLYLLTFFTSIPALALKQPYLDSEGSTSSSAVIAAVGLEFVLMVSCIGTAVALFPLLKHANEALALGFVGSRIVEGSAILLGIVVLLSLVGMEGDAGDGAGALIAVHDAAFLAGPGMLPAANAALLGTLLFRARLVPRWIPVIGLIGAPLLVLSGVLTMTGVLDQVSPLAGIAALPIAVWEFAIGVWLIAKGVRVRETTIRPDRAAPFER